MEVACIILSVYIPPKFLYWGISPVDCRSDWDVYCRNFFTKPMIVGGFGCKLTYSNFSSLCIVGWAFFLISFWNLLVKSAVMLLKLSLLIKSKIFSWYLLYLITRMEFPLSAFLMMSFFFKFVFYLLCFFLFVIGSLVHFIIPMLFM